MNIFKKTQKLIIMVFFGLLVSASSAWAVIIDFSSFDPMYAAANCGSVSCGITEIDAINNTDSIWTDFHLESGLGSLDIDTYLGTGLASLSDSGFTLDIVDISVDVGTIFTFSIDNNCFGEVCGLGSIYTLYPTTDGVIDSGDGESVPEPGTLTMLALGLFGLYLGGSRKNQH